MVPAPFELAAPHHGESSVSELWGILRRNWWIILASVVVCGGAAFLLAKRTTPIYQSSTSIRINEKSSAIPELLPLVDGSDVTTEMEVLASRTLAEDAVRGLGLQFQLVEPERVNRSTLFGGITVELDVEPEVYTLTRLAGGFAITKEDGTRLGTAIPGRPISVPGVSFVLLPEAAKHPQLVVRVSGLSSAVSAVRSGISVSRTGRDVKIVTLTYQSSDRELAAEVPNLIARRFVARRDATQKAATGSTIAFLQEQIDTLAVQLRTAEAALLA